MSHHGALVRLQLVLSNLFAELFAKGFCTKGAESEGGEGGDGKGSLQEDVEGTGMGEGKGKQDVSDQLQEEGQIEGDSAAKPEEEGGDDEPDGGKEERAKEDEGVEMTNEFDGDMKNMEQPEGEQGSDEDRALARKYESNQRSLAVLAVTTAFTVVSYFAVADGAGLAVFSPPDSSLRKAQPVRVDPEEVLRNTRNGGWVADKVDDAVAPIDMTPFMSPM